MRSRLFTIVLCILFNFAYGQKKTENVILITLDGMRWQEVFGGADSSLIRQQEHLKDPRSKEKYWRDNVNDRRKALLPFSGLPLPHKDNCMATDWLGAM